MNRIKVIMLGPPSVSVNEKTISFDYRKAEAIFYYLLLKKGVSREAIAEVFWEGKDAETARKNLRHAIFEIRKKLGPEIILSEAKERIVINPQAIIQCDIEQLKTKEDLTEYKGEFLEGFFIKDSEAFEQWVEQVRTETRVEHIKRLKNRIFELKSDDAELVNRLANEYLQIEPADEELCVFLMKMYGELQQYQKSVEIYQMLHDRLDEEYGIAPLKETTRAYYNIIEKWNAEAENMQWRPTALLFGKSGAVNEIQRLLKGNMTGTNVQPVLLLKGYSGVGKTFLLRYIQQSESVDGYIVLKGNCYLSERETSFAVWNTILGQVIDVTREYNISIEVSYINTVAEMFPTIRGLGGATALPNNVPEQVSYKAAKNSIFTIFSKLLYSKPVLLIIDDIQWMDRESLDLLSVLVRRLNDRKLVVLMTVNNKLENGTELFLDGLLYDNLLKKYEIQSFSREETAEYVHHFSKQSYSTDELNLIFNSTGGNALSLTHLIAAIEDQKKELSDLPLTLKKIVSLRLSRLSAKDRKVINLIALFKEGAPFELLAEILNIEATELMYLCGELERQSLTIVNREKGYFSVSIAHFKIAEVLMEEMNALTKKVLHQRIAKAYESHAGDFPDFEVYRILSYHFSKGGDKYRAFKYKVLWMNSYSGIFCGIRIAMYDDITEANEIESDLTYYDNLIDELMALRPFCVDIDEFERLERMLYYAKGSYEIYQGMYEEGYAIINTLIDQSKKKNDLSMLTQAYRQMVYYSIQNYDTTKMEYYVNQGLKVSQEERNEYEILTFRQLQGLLYVNLGEYQKAEESLQKSIQYAERSKSAEDRRYALLCAYGHCYLGECYRLSGDFLRAYDEYEKAIFYNYESNNFTRVALFYAYYGYAAFQNNDLDKSRLLLEKAIDLYNNRLETRGYSIALTCVAYYDVLDGKYSKVAEYIIKARQLNSRMRNKYWTAIVMYLELRIRMEMFTKKVQIPEVEGLWQGMSLMQHYEDTVALYKENMHPVELERIMSLKPAVDRSRGL